MTTATTTIAADNWLVLLEDYVLSFTYVQDYFVYKLVFLFMAVYFIVFQVLKLFSTPEPPRLTFYKPGQQQSTATISMEKSRMEELIDRCPMLKESYRPPWLWGRNGHVQTLIYGALGHHSMIRTADKRHYLSLPTDGTTVTFDVFEPLNSNPKGDFTLVLCPGIANSSESPYIRTCVHNAQEAGFRCAVLNHLGALKDERLTSPRLFKYGGTEEYAAMISKLIRVYPSTRFIAIGFSMGGNIVTKYLGERPADVGDRIVLGVSVCQGYDATRVSTNLHTWGSGRRVYEFIMTENMKRLLRNHQNEVVKPFVEQGVIDEKDVWASTSFLSLDEHYTRRVASFKTLQSYYESASSIHVIDQIRVPMVFLNAQDDPIMLPALWEPVQKFAECTPNVLFALTKHGGHLGFLEGHSFAPRNVTWLDRLIVQLSNAAVDAYCS